MTDMYKTTDPLICKEHWGQVTGLASQHRKSKRKDGPVNLTLALISISILIIATQAQISLTQPNFIHLVHVATFSDACLNFFEFCSTFILIF